MNQIELKKAKNAYIDYNLNIEYEITEKVLKYIYQRINFNKIELENIIKLNKEKITFNEIINILDHEIKSEKMYKKDGQIKLYDNNFVFATLTDSIGLIAVECFETTEVIRYFIRAIKSRNAIIISDVEYNEHSVKSFILLIIKEALKKFNIDENLLNILPYEECSYNLFDKVIYTYDKKGKTLDNSNAVSKDNTEVLYIFVEDRLFKDNVYEEIKRIQQDKKQVELISGNFDDAIKKINKYTSKGSVIYTSNAKLAYKFINLVKAENVFVNASLVNMKTIEQINNPLYFRKNVSFQIPSNTKDNITMEENVKIQEIIEEKSTNELALTKVSVSIFEKIKLIFKRIFKKY